MSCLLKRKRFPGAMTMRYENPEVWEKSCWQEIVLTGKAKVTCEIQNCKGTKENHNKYYQWIHHRSGHHINVILIKDFNAIS